MPDKDAEDARRTGLNIARYARSRRPTIDPDFEMKKRPWRWVRQAGGRTRSRMRRLRPRSRSGKR